MIRAEVEGLGILEFPDGTDPAIIQATIKKQLNVAPPTPEIEPEPEINEPSFIDQALGVGEATLALGSAVPAGIAAGIAGIGESLNPLRPLGSAERSVSSVQEALTFQPRTKEGKKRLEGTIKTLEPIATLIDKVRLGDETFESGGGALLATINEIWPELLSAIFGVKGVGGKDVGGKAELPSGNQPGTLSSTPLPFKADTKPGKLPGNLKPKDVIKEEIALGKPIARTAKFDLTDTDFTAKGDLSVKGIKSSKLAKKAIDQGWDESFVSWVKTVDKKTRENLKEMVGIVKRRVGETKDFSFNGRPSDVLGKSLKRRIDRVRRVQKQSGSLIKKVSKQQLSGKQIDISNPLNDFKAKIFELGGKVNDKGELKFGIDSQLFGQASKQKALKDVFNKIDSLGDVADGYNAHRLKQFISEFIDFGKGSKEGISANTERILNDFRHGINETLKGQSKAYDKVNTAYSNSTKALSDFQKAAGGSIDLFGPEANAATGRVLRKLLSNVQNRENLSAAMKQMEDVAIKHGRGKYTDDLTAQAKAVNEIERLMGSFAETSLKGEITSAGQRIAESPSIRQLGTEAVKLSASQLQKMRRNETKQIRALEMLLARP